MRLIQSIVLSFNNMIVDNYLQNDRVQHTFYQVFASIFFFKCFSSRVSICILYSSAHSTAWHLITNPQKIIPSMWKVPCPQGLWQNDSRSPWFCLSFIKSWANIVSCQDKLLHCSAAAGDPATKAAHRPLSLLIIYC